LKIGYLFVSIYLVWFLWQVGSVAVLYFSIYFFNRGRSLTAMLVALTLGIPLIVWLLLRMRPLIPSKIRKSALWYLPFVLVFSPLISYSAIQLFEAVSTPAVSLITVKADLSVDGYLNVDADIVNSTDERLVLHGSFVHIVGLPKVDKSKVGKPADEHGHPFFMADDGSLMLGVDHSFPRYTVLEPKKTTSIKVRGDRKWGADM